MDVILQKHIEHLGQSGDVVEVDDDLARNYLLPRQLAVSVDADPMVDLAVSLHPGLRVPAGKALGQSVDALNMLGLYYGLRVPENPEGTLLLRATEVFGDSKTAIEWLNEKIPSLGGRKPIEAFAGSEEDKQRVLTILGRIEAGVF